MEGASGAPAYLRVRGGGALKRIVVLFVVATLLVLALAAPAFAARHFPPTGGEPPNGNACHGAPHVPFDCEPN